MSPFRIFLTFHQKGKSCFFCVAKLFIPKLITQETSSYLENTSFASFPKMAHLKTSDVPFMLKSLIRYFSRIARTKFPRFCSFFALLNNLFERIYTTLNLFYSYRNILDSHGLDSTVSEVLTTSLTFTRFFPQSLEILTRS